jgi:hypothetical protein
MPDPDAAFRGAAQLAAPLTGNAQHGLTLPTAYLFAQVT